MATGAMSHPQAVPRRMSRAEVVETVLDKGLVIDGYARGAAIGLELGTLDGRLATASLDTYLRYAVLTERLMLGPAIPAVT